MNKIFKDKDARKSITIITLSGILISTFIMLLLHFDGIKEFFSKLFSVLSPFIWGILFAFIMNKIAIKIENALNKKWSLKTRRFIGALCATLLLIIVIVVALVVITPSIIDSLSSLSGVLKDFSTNPNDWINSIQNTLHLPAELVNKLYEYSSEIAKGLWTAVQNIIPNIVSVTVTTAKGLVNFIIGFVVCLYLLIDRQKIAYSLKRLSSIFLDEKQYTKGRKIMYMALEKFTNFFSGKIFDSIIVGIICFICMLFINPQYSALIAIIVGITNIVPFFGPFIGAIPCALVLLIVDPLDSLIFIIMILILQQIDGNIIGPRILGDSVGLSSLWIMFAIIVGGAYFGFFGMLLGVPIFSVIYYVVKEYVDDKIEEKNKEANE